MKMDYRNTLTSLDGDFVNLTVSDKDGSDHYRINLNERNELSDRIRDLQDKNYAANTEIAELRAANAGLTCKLLDKVPGYKEKQDAINKRIEAARDKMTRSRVWANLECKHPTTQGTFDIGPPRSTAVSRAPAVKPKLTFYGPTDY